MPPGLTVPAWEIALVAVLLLLALWAAWHD
jgi:hypothetical protein